MTTPRSEVARPTMHVIDDALVDHVLKTEGR